MQGHTLVAMAATPTLTTSRNIRPDQLYAPTPCTDYDVRKLINHLLYWGPSLEGAARKESVSPPAAGEPDADLTGDDWADRLEAHFNRLAVAWSEPDAWAGTAPMGGPMELPASMIGGMVLGEFVVHGWDLARATGQRPRWDERVVTFLHHEVERTAEQGRAMGVYGNRVQVPDSASHLARTLGLTGRDPNWTPDPTRTR